MLWEGRTGQLPTQIEILHEAQLSVLKEATKAAEVPNNHIQNQIKSAQSYSLWGCYAGGEVFAQNELNWVCAPAFILGSMVIIN